MAEEGGSLPLQGQNDLLFRLGLLLLLRVTTLETGSRPNCEGGGDDDGRRGCDADGGVMVQTALAIFAVKYEAAALSPPAPAREYLIAACVFYIKVWCSRCGRLSLPSFFSIFFSIAERQRIKVQE